MNRIEIYRNKTTLTRNQQLYISEQLYVRAIISKERLCLQNWRSREGKQIVSINY